ncbi:MAG: VCBS repeat-containing protein, partial [Pirellulaceae bacterium]|nr:VCBS repeat-containing protein [Pirellulaceae bacterium]
FDGDGDIDIVAGTLNDASSATLSWYQNDGLENFTKNTITTGAMTANTIRDLDVADVDGDGFLDIVTVSQLDNRIAWWKNDGLGNFTQNIEATFSSGRSIQAVDFDNDGDIDFIAGRSGSGNTIVWYDNDGAENFTARTVATQATADQVTSLDVADIDGDLDLDIVAASFANDKFLWFEHQGAGSFVTHTIDSGVSVDGAVYVSIADVDGDGDMDVATASQYANVVAYYKNDGAGNFGAGPEWSITANGARSVFAADLENDGDIDIVAGAYTDQTIIAHINDGMATPGFTANTISSTSAYPIDLAFGDIDGDYDLDLIEAAYTPDDEVRWYENHGGFQTHADTFENTTLTFSTANGNVVSISDSDAGGAAVRVTLTSTNGTVTLSSLTGLTFNVGDGTDDPTMTFEGTIANINAALDGLVFTPTNDFTGTANLQIDTNDLGNTGSGGAQSDSDIITIAVKPRSVTVDTTVAYNSTDVRYGDTSSISALLANRGSDRRISIREAIDAANNTANGAAADEIHFNIATSDPGHVDPDATPGNGDEFWVMQPTSDLPHINEAVIIDATTQAGFTVGSPVIELDGTDSSFLNDGLTFLVGSDGSTVRGLSFTSWMNGIRINSDNNTIAGNYFGVNAAGAAEANLTDGIRINGSTNTIGGLTAADRNIISNSNSDGIQIHGDSNIILGNYIGTDPTGLLDWGNGGRGINIDGGASNVIGG